MYSHGCCPLCGVCDSGTAVRTTKHPYKEIKTAPWWNFWTPVERKYIENKTQYSCKRCGQDVVDLRCGCEISPSPWEIKK